MLPSTLLVISVFECLQEGKDASGVPLLILKFKGTHNSPFSRPATLGSAVMLRMKLMYEPNRSVYGGCIRGNAKCDLFPAYAFE